MDLQQLLAAARTGDEEAFRSFVEPYLGAAYRTALLIALDRELARDAVQEALVRVFQNLDRIRPAEPFRPWFMRVVINEARRVARSQRRQPALLGELPDIPATAVAAPEAQVLAAEDRRQRQPWPLRLLQNIQGRLS